MFSFKANASKIFLYLLTFYSSFLIYGCEANSKILVHSNKTNPVASCMLKIVQKYVPCSDFISIVIFEGAHGSGVIKTINADLCYSVALKSSNEKRWLIWTETYIVIAESSNDFAKILSQLANDLYWNPRARFIIQTNENSKYEIIQIFKTLLIHNVYNVIVLSMDGNDVIVNTYYPFGNNQCGRHFADIITLGECENAVKSSVLFSRKVTPNMKNCTVKIMLHEDIPAIIFKSSNYTVFDEYVPGLEQYLLDNIGPLNNLSYKYEPMIVRDNFGVVFNNRTVTGIFAMLQGGLVDMAVGGFLLLKNRGIVFDYIWGYNFEQLSLFTPVVDSKSWKNISKGLGPRAWILTILSSCVVCALGILIATLYPEVAQQRLVLVFKFFGFFFQGNSDKGLLKVKRMRLLLCCWIWLTFFIANFYTTAMFSMVTAQIGSKQVFDVDDLNRLPFKPCISDNIRNLFSYAYNEPLPQNVPTPKCRYTSTSLTEVGLKKDLYTIGIKQNYKLRAYEFTNFRGQSTVDNWDFSSTFVTVLYVRKGDPLKETLEKDAKHMFEAGLIQKHFDILCLRSHSAIMRKSNSFIRVRLDYLKIHFYVLGFGIILSTAIFLLEISVTFVKPRYVL